MNPQNNLPNQNPAEQGYQPVPLAPQPTPQPVSAPPQAPGYAAPPQPQPGAFNTFPQPQNPYATQQPTVAPTQPQANAPLPPNSPQGTPLPQQPMSPAGNAPKRFNKLPKLPLIIAAVVVVLGIGGWLAYGALGSGGGVAVTVPADWKSLDTQLGFTVKAPANWEIESEKEQTEEDGYKSTTVNLSPKIEDVDVSESEADDEDDDFSADLLLGVVAIAFEPKGNPDKAAFEKYVTNKENVGEVFALFGGDMDKVTVTHTTVKIKGKEWLKVDATFDNNVFTTLYYWNKNKAIGLSTFKLNEEFGGSKDSSPYDTYLLPMAASIEIAK